jgi:hypothetical protein
VGLAATRLVYPNADDGAIMKQDETSHGLPLPRVVGQLRSDVCMGAMAADACGSVGVRCRVCPAP